MSPPCPQARRRVPRHVVAGPSGLLAPESAILGGGFGGLVTAATYVPRRRRWRVGRRVVCAAVAGACRSFAPPLPALAVPEEGRGLPVPGTRGLLEPGADLGGALRVLAVERAPLEDALDGLGHVQRQ